MTSIRKHDLFNLAGPSCAKVRLCYPTVKLSLIRYVLPKRLCIQRAVIHPKDSVIHSLKTRGQIDFVDVKRMCRDSIR